MKPPAVVAVTTEADRAGHLFTVVRVERAPVNIVPGELPRAEDVPADIVAALAEWAGA